jgi:hypothetical protein
MNEWIWGSVAFSVTCLVVYMVSQWWRENAQDHVRSEVEPPKEYKL